MHVAKNTQPAVHRPPAPELMPASALHEQKEQPTRRATHLEFEPAHTEDRELWMMAEPKAPKARVLPTLTVPHNPKMVADALHRAVDYHVEVTRKLIDRLTRS